MASMARHRARRLGRAIYSIAADYPAELARGLPIKEDERFVLFLAWDATRVSDHALMALALDLVRMGLSYIVAWGPDCERVHDIFDDADILENPQANEAETEIFIISTWHDHESLEQALWFALNCAFPVSAYESATVATVAASLANADWAESIRAYLEDPKALDTAIGL
jgi:hypothetical protein